MKKEKVKFIFYVQNLIRLQWKPINLSTWSCLHSKIFHFNWTRDEKMFSNQLVKSLLCLINDWNSIFCSEANWFSCELSQHFRWHAVGKLSGKKSSVVNSSEFEWYLKWRVSRRRQRCWNTVHTSLNTWHIFFYLIWYYLVARWLLCLLAQTHFTSHQLKEVSEGKEIILFFLSAESSCSIVNVSGCSSEY